MKEKFKALLSQYLEYIQEDVSPQTPEVKETLEEMAKINTENPEVVDNYKDEMAEVTAAAYANPRYANFQTMQEVLGAVEGGIDLFNTFSNIATAKRQISDASEAADKLQRPEIPSLTPKSEELKEATLDARLQSRGRLKEIDPILQQNLNLLRKGLGVAKTASTGQAGIYGSLGQAAVNQAQQANIAAIPAIERAKRQRDSRYDSLVQTGINEDFNRSQERQSIYGLQNAQYSQDAQAIGNLGAMGNYNLAAQRQGLGGALSSALQPIAGGIMNNMRFKNLQPNVPQTKRATGYSTLGNINPKYDSINQRMNDSLASYFG